VREQYEQRAFSFILSRIFIGQTSITIERVFTNSWKQ